MPPQVGCLTPEEIAVYEDDFRRFDADGSGMLEKDEIEKLLQLQLGRDCTSDELEQYLSQADLNGDRKLSLDEYIGSIHGPNWKSLELPDANNATGTHTEICNGRGEQAGATLSSALMEICVVTWAGHHLPIQAEPHVTIAEFKQSIGPQKGVDPQHFELHKTSESGIYESELQDGQTLGDCGVGEGVALTLRKKADAPADVEEEVYIGED